MKFRITSPVGDVVKGHSVFSSSEVELQEFEIPSDGQKSSCYVLTSPGDNLTVRIAVTLAPQVEEFVDLVVDGILRASTPIKKTKTKNFNYDVSFDKVLFYAFKDDKKKGLKLGHMQIQSRDTSKDLPIVSDQPNSPVGTIELQMWRKYPDDRDGSTPNPEAIKRSPHLEEYPRWMDLTPRVSTEPIPPSFEVGFTGDSKNTKHMKEKIMDERVGFTLFHTIIYRTASSADLRKLGFEDVPNHYANATLGVEESEEPSGLGSPTLEAATTNPLLDSSKADFKTLPKPKVPKTAPPTHQMKDINTMMEDLSSVNTLDQPESEIPDNLEASATVEDEELSQAGNDELLQSEDTSEIAGKEATAQQGIAPGQNTPTKKKGSVLPGVKGAPAHKAWLDKEATQSQESLQLTPPRELSPELAKTSFEKQLSLALQTSSGSRVAEEQQTSTGTPLTPPPSAQKPDTENTTIEPLTPAEHSLLTPHSDNGAPVTSGAAADLQASPLPDSQVSTQSFNNTQDRLEAMRALQAVESHLETSDLPSTPANPNPPQLTTDLSTLSETSTEIITPEDIARLTQENTPGTPDTAPSFHPPREMSPISSFTLPPRMIDTIKGNNKNTELVGLGLNLDPIVSKTQDQASPTKPRTALPSSRPTKTTAIGSDASPKNETAEPSSNPARLGNKSGDPIPPISQGHSFSRPLPKVPSKATTTKKDSQARPSPKDASAQANLKVTKLGSPPKTGQSSVNKATTKSVHFPSNSSEIPSFSQNQKRKADNITSSDSNDPKTTSPRKAANPPALRNSEEIQRRAAEAQARIAAAQKMKQKLEEETKAAEAFAAEREKVRRLEEEAANLERENAERKAKIDAMYGSFV
ncbi:hypothetical protein G7Y89_g11549 [Cudoniella acicularis]|uniref:Uncharacterized protein n=1 Tax=Cudoniella acicularis TaxID=354080 RepID=A0A8H4W0J5_9HELO|nr:hypothetical protein G7Y89_g11549 [Cudoniella acicularis]